MTDSFLDIDEVLRKNIAALLDRTGRTQTELSAYCGHERSWGNKLVLGERRMTMSDLPKVAAFFGLTVSQFVLPGLTDRRHGATDRRASAGPDFTIHRRLQGASDDQTDSSAAPDQQEKPPKGRPGSRDNIDHTALDAPRDVLAGQLIQRAADTRRARRGQTARRRPADTAADAEG